MGASALGTAVGGRARKAADPQPDHSLSSQLGGSQGSWGCSGRLCGDQPSPALPRPGRPQGLWGQSCGSEHELRGQERASPSDLGRRSKSNHPTGCVRLRLLRQLQPTPGAGASPAPREGAGEHNPHPGGGHLQSPLAGQGVCNQRSGRSRLKYRIFFVSVLEPGSSRSGVTGLFLWRPCRVDGYLPAVSSNGLPLGRT